VCGFSNELLSNYAPLLLQAIPRPTPALRQVPYDILKRTLQIAGLAVQAITEVHFYFVVLQIIDARRAEYRAGRFIIRNAFLAYGFILQQDMAFLSFVMRRAGEINIRQFVDNDFVIRLRQWFG
jgi:hypothetical protein